MNRGSGDIARLNEVFDQCLDLLDEAAKLIQSIPLEPVKGNLYDLGEVIGTILYVRKNIYNLDPSLHKPLSEEQARVGREMAEYRGFAADSVRVLKEQGRYEEAVDLLRKFIKQRPKNRFVAIAEQEIKILLNRKI